jgi:uncharacterized protein YeaO (DUF488 family)
LAKTVAAKSDPNEFRRKYVEEMRSRLKLDSKQISTLNQILDETEVQVRDVHQKYRPEMTSIHNAQVDRVKGILTNGQQTEYQKMLDEREAKRQAEKK